MPKHQRSAISSVQGLPRPVRSQAPPQFTTGEIVRGLTLFTLCFLDDASHQGPPLEPVLAIGNTFASILPLLNLYPLSTFCYFFLVRFFPSPFFCEVIGLIFGINLFQKFPSQGLRAASVGARLVTVVIYKNRWEASSSRYCLFVVRF